ncbi:hypothetical protein pdam_00024577 [Pocillopora damicornis]|uniref:Uncharacterized protein n=1 Tax=Pocillopora damicornis TaxID=46731 RepID=A0A3M6U9N3_POCDA|nr:hypothetical protein pdam_00024577 [Pocillopora damicornis]
MHFITNLSSISSLTVRSMKAQAGDYKPVIDVVEPPELVTDERKYVTRQTVPLLYQQYGQALMFVPIIAGNPKHRPYPRSLKNENTRWRDNINTIRQEAPLINRKRTLCQDFRQNLEGYVINSTTY